MVSLSVFRFLIVALVSTSTLSFQYGTQRRLSMVSKTPATSHIEVPATNDKLKFGLGKFAFSLIPLTPESQGRRKTLFKEVVKDKIWTLDQLQGVINVNVPVRSTVIKLEEGGLFINNPVAPTKECISMVKELEQKHGPVKYIVLSSLAIEHKGTVGAFASYFPKATVYYQPGQYAFPVNLPPFFFFPVGKTIKEIPYDYTKAPWANEIEHHVLGPLKPPSVGGYGETAFYHKATKTLLVTDAVVRVDDEPPEIVQEDPRALLYHARDDMYEIVQDTPENRRKGWRRMVLFGLTFQPSGIDIEDLFQSIRNTKNVPSEMKVLGRGTIPISEGLYPWKWVRSEMPSFRALQGGLLVAPILQKLLFNREPEMVLEWADKVSKWPFTRIIPCHLANDLKADGKMFRKAFEFLESDEIISDSKSSKNSNQKGLFSFFGLSTSSSSSSSSSSSASSSTAVLTKPSSTTNKSTATTTTTTITTTNTTVKKRKLSGPQPLDEDLTVLNTASILLTKQGVVKPEAPLVPRKR